MSAPLFEDFARDLLHGTHHVAFLLRTVTDHHDLLQLVGRLFQRHVERRLVPDTEFLRHIADKLDKKRLAAVYGDRESSVHIGGDSARSPLDDDRRPENGFARLTAHHALQIIGPGQRRERERDTQQEQKEPPATGQTPDRLVFIGTLFHLKKVCVCWL